MNKQPILGRFKHSKISWSTHRPVEKQGSFSPCLFFTLNKPLHLLLVKSTLIFTSVHTFIHTPTLTLVSETTESKIYRSGIILKTISHSVKNKIGIERIEKLRFVTTCGTCPYLSLQDLMKCILRDARCCIWVRTTLSVKTSLGLKGLGAALLRKSWVKWWMEIWQKKEENCSQQVSRGGSALLFWDITCTASTPGILSSGRRWTYWGGSRGKKQKWSEA